MKRWQIVVEYERKLYRPDVWYWEIQDEFTNKTIAAGRSATMQECFDDVSTAVDGDLFDSGE